MTSRIRSQRFLSFLAVLVALSFFGGRILFPVLLIALVIEFLFLKLADVLAERCLRREESQRAE